MKKINLLLALPTALLLFSCTKDNSPKPPKEPTHTIGYYVLSEGNIGRNNATLGYYDVATKAYTPDYFGQQNPGQTLGDLPNDLVIYGTKAYVTLTKGNQVIVLNAANGKVQASLPVSGARSLAVSGGKVYVSSYKGEVVRIDTTTLALTATKVTGEYCEGIAVLNGKLYVANNAVPGGAQTSGNTVSVIDLPTFTETAQITTPVNPVGLTVGGSNLYLITSGEYDENWNLKVDAQLHRIDPSQKKIVYTFPGVAASEMAVLGDYLYTLHFSYETFTGSSHKINMGTNAVSDFLPVAPTMSIYGINANPLTKELFVINSDYTATGTIDSYNGDGVLQYQMTNKAKGPYVSKVVPLNK